MDDSQRKRNYRIDILELKSTLSEMKISLNGFNSSLDMMEEKVVNLKKDQ